LNLPVSIDFDRTGREGDMATAPQELALNRLAMSSSIRQTAPVFRFEATEERTTEGRRYSPNGFGAFLLRKASEFAPPAELKFRLETGWEDPSREVIRRKTRTAQNTEGETLLIRFKQSSTTGPRTFRRKGAKSKWRKRVRARAESHRA
jgi:hypothetical protein